MCYITSWLTEESEAGHCSVRQDDGESLQTHAIWTDANSQGGKPCGYEREREACMSCSVNKENAYLEQRGLEDRIQRWGQRGAASDRAEMHMEPLRLLWFFFWVLRSYGRTLKRPLFLHNISLRIIRLPKNLWYDLLVLFLRMQVAQVKTDLSEHHFTNGEWTYR